MSEQPPQEPKKKSKGLPTWLLFLGTFAIVSLIGNIVFGGNTWINSGMNYINSTIAALSVERDTTRDDFCLSGQVAESDKENALTVVSEAESLVQTTTGAIGFASLDEDPEQLLTGIGIVRDSGPRYLELGNRLLTAKDCNDETFEYLMEDFGTTMVDMGENFSKWDPETLATDPLLLITATPLIENAASKAKAILTYVENLK